LIPVVTRAIEKRNTASGVKCVASIEAKPRKKNGGLETEGGGEGICPFFIDGGFARKGEII